MEGNELIAFQIISNVGMAKSKFIAGLNFAKLNDYVNAEAAIIEGQTFLTAGHKIHSDIIQQEAQGHKTEFSLLLMHAEDQFMTVETLKLIIVELIAMRKEFIRV